MKAKYIKIQNFRSIKNQIEINIENILGKECCILLGINESGKSNILKAVSLLDGIGGIDYNIDVNADAEENGEPIELKIGLDIIYGLHHRNILIEGGMPENLANNIKIQRAEREIEVQQNNVRTDLIYIWIKDNKKVFNDYVLTDIEYEQAGIKKKKKGIELRNGDNEILEEGIIINLVDKDSLEKFIEDNFFDHFNLLVPSIIFWKSEDKYLINKEIDLNIFKDDTSVSLPLKNCFTIAGFSDIKEKIESINGKPGKIETMKEQLTYSVTKHVNNVWKEHKINIKFVINDMKLSFYIEDKDNTLPKYEVSQRSDGFKHFISILLNISVENETDNLKNKIIILDEPEVHLHPSGAKYLRDELLKISKNNFVIFATHSIYMVDKKNLDRHISVKKEDGITKVTQIEKDNPYKEEVLYESLGTSVLEHVENNVLIFEGKTDRDIFDFYIKNFGRKLKTPNISLISADGCANIIKYTKFFNKKIIKGFVLFDSDKDGITEKTKVLKEVGYTSKNTFDINSIISTKKESTLEDLFQSKYLIDSVSDLYGGLIITIDETKPYLEQMKLQLKNHKKAYRKEENQKLKSIFLTKILRISKVDLHKEIYYGFFEELIKKINV